MAGPDYIVDIDGIEQPRPARSPAPESRGRPWLAMYWRCCSVYSRVYRNRRRDAYAGTCPRCGRPIRVAIGPGGTDARFFEAT